VHIIFLVFRRNRVTEAVRQRWPGNNIPTFRNNPVASTELDKLVDSLMKSCKDEKLSFGREAIKKHVMDTANERRRQIRDGYDYEQVRATLMFCNINIYM